MAILLNRQRLSQVIAFVLVAAIVVTPVYSQQSIGTILAS